jgi:hypothetical protein
MPPKYARLAGLGAFGASAGLLGLFLLLAFISRPTLLGGIDSTSAAVTWIALGGLFLALIGAHIVIGRQLLRLARGADVKHPL